MSNGTVSRAYATIIVCVIILSGPCISWGEEMEYRLLLHLEHTTYLSKLPTQNDDRWFEVLSFDCKSKVSTKTSPDAPVQTEIGYDGTNVFTLVHGAGGKTTIGGDVKGYSDSASVRNAKTEVFHQNLGAIWWIYVIPCEVTNHEGRIRDFMGLLGEKNAAQLYYRFTQSDDHTRIGATDCALYLDIPESANVPPIATLRVSQAIITNNLLIVTSARVTRFNQIERDDSGQPLPLETFDISCDRISCEKKSIFTTPSLTQNSSILDYRPSKSIAFEYIGSEWRTPEDLPAMVSKQAALARDIGDKVDLQKSPARKIGVPVICAILAAGAIIAFFSSRLRKK